jgi:hypothetical protein
MTQGVVPTFDPTSGASGGAAAAGGGGADLSALALTTVDLTDGTWTLLDPDSLVKGVAESGGDHTVTMNALGSGSTNYAWSSGSTMRAPRWYIPLIADNAAGGTVRITTDDTFIVLFKMVKGTPTTPFSTEIVIAGCIDPTGLTSGTIVGMGGIIEYAYDGLQGYGSWAFLSKTASTNGTSVSSTVSALWSGRRAGTSAYVIQNAAGTYVANGNRAANSNLTASTDMYLMVGLGTRSNATITDNDDAVFKLEYRVVKLPT